MSIQQYNNSNIINSLVFRHRLSMCNSPSGPSTCYVDHARKTWTHRDLSDSDSQVVDIKSWVTMPSSQHELLMGINLNK